MRTGTPKLTSRLLISALWITALYCGCSTQSNVTVQGNAMLGPVSGATVNVYAVNPSTGRLNTSQLLGTAVTDLNGNYSVRIPTNQVPQGPLGIQLSSGTYTEEAGGQAVSLCRTTYTTLVPTQGASAQITAAVGPLPDMAYQSFKSRTASGMPATVSVDQAINDSNYQVSQAFGLPDVVGVLPTSTRVVLPSDAHGQYSVVLTAISQAAKTAGTDSATLASVYAQSFVQNGNFASVGSASVTMTDAKGHTITLTPPSFSQLQITVSQIGNGQLVVGDVAPPSSFQPPLLNAYPTAQAPSTYAPGQTASAPLPPPVCYPDAKGNFSGCMLYTLFLQCPEQQSCLTDTFTANLMQNVEVLLQNRAAAISGWDPDLDQPISTTAVQDSCTNIGQVVSYVNANAPYFASLWGGTLDSIQMDVTQLVTELQNELGIVGCSPAAVTGSSPAKSTTFDTCSIKFHDRTSPDVFSELNRVEDEIRSYARCQ